MKSAAIALLLMTSASAATLAIAQPFEDKKPDTMVVASAQISGSSPEMVQVDTTHQAPLGEADARSVASDREVGEARRAYRNQCNQFESAAFCECVTAGVAQVLPPAEVRLAASTIGQRITAQGDASLADNNDRVPEGAPPMSRIEQVEGHYADACHSFRR